MYNTSELTMGHKLKAGDTLHYDDVNGVWSPLFLLSYYEEYVGEGTIRLKSIDTEAKTAELEAVQETVVSGDANGDGEFNVADAVILQKYLLCAADVEAVIAESADMNGDNIVDIFDVIMMRKILIE